MDQVCALDGSSSYRLVDAGLGWEPGEEATLRVSSSQIIEGLLIAGLDVVVLAWVAPSPGVVSLWSVGVTCL